MAATFEPSGPGSLVRRTRYGDDKIGVRRTPAGYVCVIFVDSSGEAVSFGMTAGEARMLADLVLRHSGETPA